MNALESSYAERLFRWRDMAIDRIGSVVRLDNGARVIQTGSIQVGSTMELKADLLNLRVRMQNFGRGQVNEEIKRLTG